MSAVYNGVFSMTSGVVLFRRNNFDSPLDVVVRYGTLMALLIASAASDSVSLKDLLVELAKLLA